MDRTEMRRLSGRRLVPRRYWGSVGGTDTDGVDADVEVTVACPPSPVAGAVAPCASPPPAPAPRRRRPVEEDTRQISPGDERRQRVRHLAALYALGGAVIGAAPIPNPDMPLLVSVESRLVADIARLYNPDGVKSAVARAVPLIGFGGYLLRGLSRRGQRRLPMLGWAINGLIAYAGVRLTGEYVLRWCESRRRQFD